MGLGLYTNATPGTKLSLAGAFTNPFTVTLDGRAGGQIEQRLYLRNDDVTFYYTGITLRPIDTIGNSITDGTDGYSWKLRAGNTQPTSDEWAAITAGALISFADVGGLGSPNTSTYQPFWVRVEIPKFAAINTFTDVQLRIQATQNNV
jgi:hypothetical protein